MCLLMAAVYVNSNNNNINIIILLLLFIDFFAFSLLNRRET